jgi:hypothetical protein
MCRAAAHYRICSSVSLLFEWGIGPADFECFVASLESPALLQSMAQLMSDQPLAFTLIWPVRTCREVDVLAERKRPGVDFVRGGMARRIVMNTHIGESSAVERPQRVAQPKGKRFPALREL